MRNTLLVWCSFAGIALAVDVADAAIIAEVEPNNTRATAQNVDGNFTLEFDANIGDDTSNTSTVIPHVSVRATGDGTFDYYSFTVPTAGAIGIFDTDSTNFDTELFLYNSAGTLLIANDDSPTTFGAAGSTSIFDSFIQITFTTPGIYTIGVGKFPSESSAGSIVGTAPGPNDFYTLQISVQGGAIPEPSTFVMFGLGALSLAGSAFRRRKQVKNSRG